MPSITVQPHLVLERILSLEIVRVTERAAVSGGRFRGRGNEKAADQAAADAMRRELNKLPIDGTVVIGEGERDEAPMLFIGEEVGNRSGPKVDIAVDPLEGTTLCAKNMPGSIATMAMAEGGTLLNAPDVYMDKIAIGPGYPKGVVDLDAAPEDNIRALAKAKDVKPENITALVLERPRHAKLIESIRHVGASVSLITDGDVAGVIHTAEPATGIDIYLGIVRAGGRSGRGGIALHRRPDARPAHPRYRGEARARGENGHPGPAQALRDGRYGAWRLPVFRNGGYHGLDVARREVRQGHDRDRDRGDAISHRHGAPYPRRTQAVREVPSRLILLTESARLAPAAEADPDMTMNIAFSNRLFLGVERSACGRSWRDRLDERGAQALAIAQRHAMPEILARILAGRNVDIDEVDTFLDPTVKRLMPDPYVLNSMQAAAERIADAVQRGERVAIFGDYDVDGNFFGLAGAVPARGRPRSDGAHSRPHFRGLWAEC